MGEKPMSVRDDLLFVDDLMLLLVARLAGPCRRRTFHRSRRPDASAVIWDFAQRHPKGSPA